MKNKYKAYTKKIKIRRFLKEASEKVKDKQKNEEYVANIQKIDIKRKSRRRKIEGFGMKSEGVFGAKN